MTTIKAAMCHELRDPLTIEDDILRAPETGEVEVMPDAAAICHSGISLADGAWGGALPVVGAKMGAVVLQRGIPWAVELYQQGRLMLHELIAGQWSMDQINEAIADTKSGAAKRNVIMF